MSDKPHENTTYVATSEAIKPILAAVLAGVARAPEKLTHAELDSAIEDAMHVSLYKGPRNPEFSDYLLTIRLLSLLLDRAVRLKAGGA